jgi:hypothetical protein
VAILRSTSSAGSSGTFITCPKPQGVVAGDVLIAFQTNDAIGDGDMSTPTGGATWQLLGQRSQIEWAGTRVWWKVAGPSEPATYRFTQSGVDPEFPFLFSGGVVAIAAISDADGTTPQIASLQNGEDNSVACPSVVATNAPGVTLRWAASANNSGVWQPPSGHTELADRRQDGSTASLAFRTRTTAGSTGTASFTYVSDITLTQSHGFTVSVGGTAAPVPEPEPVNPPSKDIHYKYRFCDLLTDNFITYLDLSDVSYDRRIGEPGSFSATIPMPSLDMVEKVATIIPRYPGDLSTGPGRIVVHVYRNGIVWGSYIIWSASIESGDRGDLQARISGSSLESYLGRVEIREDLDYTDEDQLQIARSLIESLQAQTHADIGLTVEAGSSGVTRTVSYLAGESSTYGQRLTELADLDNGFETMIHTSDSGTGTITREMLLGYPKLGSDTTEHVFSQPGNVIGFNEDIDATRGGTSFVARGESASTDASAASGPTLSVPHDATAHLAAGWPRLDATITAHFERDTDTLDSYAARWAARNAGAVRVHQVSIRLDGDDFTPANLGDMARVVLVNNWWPRVNGAASFDQSWRVIGIAVQATTRGQRETAELIFEEVIDS